MVPVLLRASFVHCGVAPLCPWRALWRWRGCTGGLQAAIALSSPRSCIAPSLGAVSCGPFVVVLPVLLLTTHVRARFGVVS